MQVRALTWNVFHGRDFPPERELLTWRSRLLRITERGRTHVQVNRDLLDEFVAVLDSAPWDVALLQECPPRWTKQLAERLGAHPHGVLTSRNSFAPLRSIAARLNPDLIASAEGGSNLTLVRGTTPTMCRELVLCPGPKPERRTMAFTRLASRVCVANLHASTGAANRPRAEDELRLAAETSLRWAGGAPLILGGDLNVRPSDSDIYDELAERFGLRAPTAPDSLDHLLCTALEPVEPPAPWPAERREVARHGLALRLSDHAPVEAVFEAPASG
jgi:endonuclease/exonuclease/phosphatase family metal-dependent hydrolase